MVRVSRASYAGGQDLAPRPIHSTLSPDKITAAGSRPKEAAPAPQRYLAGSG